MEDKKVQNTNPGTVCGKAVTKEQRPSTAPCLADINSLEGLWLLLGDGLLEDKGDRDLDEDGDVEEDVLDNESLKSDMMAGKLSGLMNWQWTIPPSTCAAFTRTSTWSSVRLRRTNDTICSFKSLWHAVGLQRRTKLLKTTAWRKSRVARRVLQQVS